MACAITSGITLDCRDSMGGLKEVYLIALADISSFAVSSGVVTGITKASGKRFYKFEHLPQTADWAAETTGSDENGSVYWANTLNLQINKMNAANRNMVKLLASNRVVAVAIDRQGVGMLLGATMGLSTNGGTMGSGKAFGDANGSKPVLTGAEPEPPYEVNAATLLTLETPGS